MFLQYDQPPVTAIRTNPGDFLSHNSHSLEVKRSLLLLLFVALNSRPFSSSSCLPHFPSPHVSSRIARTFLSDYKASVQRPLGPGFIKSYISECACCLFERCVPCVCICMTGRPSVHACPETPAYLPPPPPPPNPTQPPEIALCSCLYPLVDFHV